MLWYNMWTSMPDFFSVASSFQESSMTSQNQYFDALGCWVAVLPCISNGAFYFMLISCWSYGMFLSFELLRIFLSCTSMYRFPEYTSLYILGIKILNFKVTFLPLSITISNMGRFKFLYLPVFIILLVLAIIIDICLNCIMFCLHFHNDKWF